MINILKNATDWDISIHYTVTANGIETLKTRSKTIAKAIALLYIIARINAKAVKHTTYTIYGFKSEMKTNI